MHDLVHVAREVTTDARGAFRIDELVPGPEFKLFRQVKKRAGERTQPVTDRALTVRSGETTDLGDLAVKTVPEGDGDGGTP